jgi:hypothetical protein
MSEGTKVFNQEARPQDLTAVQANITGALATAVQDINAGKMPKGAGGDHFSLVGEMGMAKAGVAGFAVNLTSDIASGDIALGGAESSSFLFGGSGKGTKRDRKRAQLSSPNTSLGLPKSYEEKKAAAREMGKLRSGGGGRDFFGNVVPAAKSKASYVTKEMLLANPGLYGGAPGIALKKNNDLVVYEGEHRTGSSIVAGLLQGHENMRALAKQTGADVLMAAMETKGAEAKKEVIAVTASGAEKRKLEKRLLAPEPPKPSSKEQGDKKESERWN